MDRSTTGHCKTWKKLMDNGMDLVPKKRLSETFLFNAFCHNGIALFKSI